MAPPIGLRGTGQPQRSSVAGRTRLLDPCRTCREADRQSTGAVVLLSEVADRDSAEAISPALAPGAFPTPPPRAWGPAATSTELTGPVAEGGTGSSKQDLNPPQGAYTRRGPRSRAEYPNHAEPHGRYYARPIRHSVGRKMVLNRNYCRSVTIRTLGLKAIYLGSGLTDSNSHCAPAALQRSRDCASLFDRLPASGSDPEANHIDRLGASLHGFAFCNCKPGAHNAGDHIVIEPMDAHKQRLGSSM